MMLGAGTGTPLPSNSLLPAQPQQQQQESSPVMRTALCFTTVHMALLWASLVVASIGVACAFSLEGKTVLVTGSAGGIGKGIAKRLAAKGAKIIVHYHTREAQAQEFATELGPDRCLGVLECDFRQMSTIPGFFRAARDLTGDAQRVDVLVNNAGAITKLALDSDDDNLTVWRDTLAVNLDAPHLLGKLFADQFPRNDPTCTTDTDHGDDAGMETRGVILNVGSIHGDRSNEYMGAYAASKAGLESLTRTMALEYASRGVRANLIAPGIVPVERTHDVFRANPQTLQAWTDRIPVRRAGSVEQVAEACLPLLENEWITGTIWQIDGGMMARANMPQRQRP